MDKSELPSWAKQPAIEWLNYVEDIQDSLQTSVLAIKTSRLFADLLKKIPKDWQKELQQKGEFNNKTFLENLNIFKNSMTKLMKTDFNYLYSLGLVLLWTSVETLTSDFLLLYIKNNLSSLVEIKEA